MQDITKMTPEELTKYFEDMKAKMQEIETENARLKNLESSRKDPGQSSKSRSFASKIQEAGSFQSLVKQLDFDSAGSVRDENQDVEMGDPQSAGGFSAQHPMMKFAMMLAQEVTKINGTMTKIPGAPAHLEEAEPGCYADSPFCDSIALVEIPRKMSVPPMSPYDGTTNPQDHVAEYKQRMCNVPLPREMREAGMCKGFGSTLKGPALRWMIGIPNGTIKSFAQLVNMFNMQFASSRIMEKHSNDLYKVIQGPQESLRSYLARFNSEIIMIVGCEQGTAVEAFRRGLYQVNDLYNDLTKYTC